MTTPTTANDGDSNGDGGGGYQVQQQQQQQQQIQQINKRPDMTLQRATLQYTTVYKNCKQGVYTRALHRVITLQ